jgi:hypothetical protein
MLRCNFCKFEVDPQQPHYRKVVGWERPGRGVSDRSGSSIVMRQPVPDVVACVGCVTKLQNGVSVEQESLI